MRIALDAMGGDHGPGQLVSGAMHAVKELNCQVVLIGDRQQLQTALGGTHPRIDIVHTTEMVGMDESPLEAVRKKKDSSICVAFDLLKKKEVDAVVSAGNSGATMAAAVKYLGRLKSVSRPGIAGIFPTLKKPLVMVDVGANVDCRAKHLYQFGGMGAAFSQILLGIDNPRVGLLSIGEERGKGNALVKQTHDLLQQGSFNYIGNVEGRDMFQGNVDVIVCDGFVGNVCLKLSEGLAEAMVDMLREEIAKNLKAKVGYMLTRKAFRNFKKRTDYAEYGGAPLLGLNGTAIICHGRSNDRAIMNAVKIAAELVDKDVNKHISTLLDAPGAALAAS